MFWKTITGNNGPTIVPSETEAPELDGELSIEFVKDDVSTTDIALLRRVRANIFLGTADQPIDNIYGLAFTIKFDTAIWEESIVPGMLVLSDDTFLGEQGDVLSIGHVSQEEGRIEAAISRKDGQAINSGYGELGRIYLSLREDAATGNPNGEESLSVKIYNAMGVDADGNFFQLGATSGVIIGKDLNFDSTLTDVAEKINSELPLNIFPNPNNGSFDLFFGKINSASQVNVFDFSGKHIYAQKNTG